MHDLWCDGHLHSGRYLHHRRQPGGEQRLCPRPHRPAGSVRGSSTAVTGDHLYLHRSHTSGRGKRLHGVGHRRGIGQSRDLRHRLVDLLAVLDLGDPGHLDGGGDLCDRRQPGRERHLSRRSPSPTAGRCRTSTTDHHLHLDRQGSGGRRDLHGVGRRWAVGEPGDLQHRLLDVLGLHHRRSDRHLRRRGHLPDRRRPAGRRQLPGGTPGPAARGGHRPAPGPEPDLRDRRERPPVRGVGDAAGRGRRPEPHGHLVDGGRGDGSDPRDAERRRRRGVHLPRPRGSSGPTASPTRSPTTWGSPRPPPP